MTFTALRRKPSRFEVRKDATSIQRPLLRTERGHHGIEDALAHGRHFSVSGLFLGPFWVPSFFSGLFRFFFLRFLFYAFA
jgi:hypothetical protein